MATSDRPIESMTDEMEARQFSEKTFADILGFLNVCMCVLGDRLGLFKDLARNGPATSDELAKRTGIVERYAREWLSQMTCAEYLTIDPATQRFSLPAAHVPVLADEGGPGFMGGLYQNFQSIEAGLFGKLLHAFREGGGIAYAEYNDDFWDGLDRFTNGLMEHTLVQQFIPAMPDVKAALEKGALVADVGCGRGAVIRMLAKAFPRSHFVGYDAFAANITRANENAQAAGLVERMRFVQHNATERLPQAFDLIFSFDTLHHATDVPGFLRNIHAALNPGGIFICSEAACDDTVQGNIGPGGAVVFASSVMVCVPQVLSESEEALGNAGLPFSRMRTFCTQAGFGNIRMVKLENASNNLYEIKL